ncbi:unnamed protein product [Leptosia nina]|uniref:Uncharacterized protein n=1 Tax=Leptosia nina TaxID=320188 RepID=A0AAV1IZG4_9NEOP
MKSFIILVLLYVASANEDDFRAIDSIEQEEPCSSMGGMCTIAADCPGGHLADKPDLCPKQRKQGVECCYGLSLKETRCDKHGGICIDQNAFCNPQLVFNASNCPKDTKCCTLVY